MKGRRSNYRSLVDLDLVRGSYKFEEGANSERKEIVEGMGENLPRRNRNGYLDQGAGGIRMGDHYAVIRSKPFM